MASSETEDFDYIFFYNKDLFEKLFEEYQIINKNNKVLILKKYVVFCYLKLLSSQLSEKLVFFRKVVSIKLRMSLRL